MLTDRSRIARSRARLALCSSLAIATGLIVGPGIARAQSFQGTGTVVSGGATITTGTNVTNVDIDGTNSDAVINWSTFDTGVGGGPINFQPSGTTATFQSTNAQFTVLNRILPTDQTRQVQFNGTVIGQLQGAASQTPAGSVYFYSPGGLIIGSSAVFNVGNLGLTSAAPVVDGTGCFDCGGPPGGGQVIFSAANPGTGVDIQAGAQITGTSPAPGNYVAIVAPRISNAGSISGKRVTALVSADAATMTINVNGLFDIQVDSGTSATGTTLFNSGSIAGPAGTSGNVSRVYLVAVPKNQAITLAIANGSSLGFDIAGAADGVGNSVVLSAGYNINAGNPGGVASAGGGTGAADLSIAGSTFTSTVVGTATRNAAMFSAIGSPTTHAYSLVSLRGEANTSISADGAGSTLAIDGRANLFANRQADQPTGGTAQIFAQNGGSITIADQANLNARGIGAGGATPGSVGGNGVGGVAIIQALTGGSLTINNGVSLNANGFGGAGNAAAGGNGTGGQAQLFASGTGSSLIVNGPASVFAAGTGGAGASGFTGGNGNGGLAFINSQTAGSALLRVTGAASVSANGIGGSSINASGGTGTGGTATAASSDGNTIQFNNKLDVLALGTGGASSGGDAGSGQGGSARLTLFNSGTLSVAGDTQVLALGLGGTGGATTATVTGGSTQVTSQQNSSLSVGASLIAASGGIASDPISGINGQGSGTGGTTLVSAFTGGSIGVTAALRARSVATATSNRNATGGTADVQAFTGGTIDANELNIQVNGLGGADTGSGAGNGTGGTGRLTVNGAGSRISIANGNTTGNAAVGDLDFITAQGIGGQNNGGGSGIGGTGTGGSAVINVTNGATFSGPTTLGSPGFIRIVPRAFGGNAGTGAIAGGAATGGTIDIVVDNATFTSIDLLPSSFAQGGGALAAATGTINGGNAVGGTRNITVRNGGTMTTSFTGGAPGALGGEGSLSGRGGDASGGAASLTVDAATLTLTNRGLVFSQNTPGAGGTTGNVTGGTANGFVVNGGVVNVFDDPAQTDDFAFFANAFGASSPTAGAGGAQGTVTAGTATLTVQGGTIQGQGTVTVAAEASAQSDQYTQGGTYTGGQATLIVRGGTISNPQIVVSAEAVGANVGTGLTGTGGSATGGTASVQSGLGNSNLTNVTISARGTGGSVLGTGAGGAGTGGTAQLIANGAAITLSGSLSVDAGAQGGNGGNGGNGGAGTAGLAAVNAINNVNAASLLALNAVTLLGSGVGGTGGAGLSGGGAGGAGGAGFGGSVQALGGAGNGTLTTGNLTAFAHGAGGSGGMGGTGPTGGTGGTGGRGVGGFISVGTVSSLDNSPTNTGSASFGPVSEDASGFGGTGGAGGSGTIAGVGGRGGDAFDGASTLLVRGSPVSFSGAVTLTANATGGNGGAGSTQGAGGNATIGTDPVLMNAGGLGVTVTNRFQHPEQPGSLTAGSITGAATATGGAGSAPGSTFLADIPIRVEFTGATANVSSLDLTASAAIVTGTLPSSLSLGNATAGISNFSLVTPGPLSVALDTATLNTATLRLSAGNFVLPKTAPVAYGTINVSSGLTITTPLDFLAYANFNVGFAGGISTNGSIFTGNLTFNGPIDLTALGSITTGTITATDVSVDARQALLTAAITTGGSIDLVAGGSINTGLLTAGDTVEASSAGALTVAGASAGLVNPSTSPLAEFNVGLRSLTSVTAGNVSAKANFGVSSPGSIAVGNVNVGQAFLALPGTSLTTGSLTTSLLPNSRVYIANFSMEALGGQVTSNFNPAPIFAASPVATGGPITINGPVSAIVIQANTLQALTATGTIQTPGATVLIAGTTLNTADIVVGDRAIIVAGGTIALGNVNAGITLPSGGLRKIAIGSGSGSVSTGNLAAGFDLGVQAAGAISTGTLLGRQILLLAGGNVNTGAVSAVVGTQPVGSLYIGNFSMASPSANVFSTFQSPTAGQLPIFNLDPVRTGGSITIGGNVVAGSVRAAAGQGVSLQAITTPALSTQTGSGGFIELDSGGTVTVNGRLAAGDHIDIASRDIDIAQSGSLDALGPTGEIQLASNNPNGAFVGDGLSAGTGYALSLAEYGRLKAGQIAVIGDDMAGLATDLTIGTLTINASQLYGTNGVALFASGNRQTETPSGILRIAGAVVANGFAPTNEVDLLSGTVELEAANGSLKVNAGTDTQSSSATLGGRIVVEADHVHVASDAILTKLRADPFYAGHIDELNAPAGIQRPDGVFNALGFEINVGESFYIQNTGSRIVPAGFVTTFDNSDVFASGDRTGGTEIVINGQFQTSTGTVTGKAAFDQIIADPTPDSEQFAGFSESSQLNGCVFLTGVCAFGNNTQMAPPASEISVIIAPVLAASPPPPAVEDAGPGDSSASASDTEAAADDSDSSDGSDDEKKDKGDGDEAASPIAPPTPLISTRALDGDVNVVEPVSGAGNPALFGSAVDETTTQGGRP